MDIVLALVILSESLFPVSERGSRFGSPGTSGNVKSTWRGVKRSLSADTLPAASISL